MRKLTTTTTESQLRDWLADGETAPQIAYRLGVHANYVYVTLALLGLSQAHQADAQACCRLLAAGKNCRQIGEALGFSRRTVERALKRAGLPTTTRALLRQQQVSSSGCGSAPLPADRFQGAVGGLPVASG